MSIATPAGIMLPFRGYNPQTGEVRIFTPQERLPDGWLDLGNLPELISVANGTEIIYKDAPRIPAPLPILNVIGYACGDVVMTPDQVASAGMDISKCVPVYDMDATFRVQSTAPYIPPAKNDFPWWLIILFILAAFVIVSQGQ